MNIEFTKEELDIIIRALTEQFTKLESLSETKATKITALIEKLSAMRS